MQQQDNGGTSLKDNNIDTRRALNETIEDETINNNNNPSEDLPISVSPSVSETIYEFGTHFENPSHVVSEKVL